MKNERRSRIVSIISENDVETQEELAEILEAMGYKVTQATISRDIRRLGITKISGKDGKQKYALVADNMSTAKKRLTSRIKEAVISADCAGNLLVIKTLTGMGMAVAVDIDEMDKPEILGTIAGDDVVFCAVRDEEKACALKAEFLSILTEADKK